MVDQARALVGKQVRRVRFRLLLQVLLDSLMLCVAIGLLLTTLWFLVRPFAFSGLGEAVRWSVPAVLLGGSIIGGFVLAWLRRPNAIASSLALDEKFGLKERVTTLLTLPAEQIDSPVGQALVKDVTEHLAKLQVTSEFPLQLPVKKLLVPAGAFALALLACVFDPLLGSLNFGPRLVAVEPRRPVDMSKVQDQLDQLKKNVMQRNQVPLAKSEELKELEKEFEKLINQPIEKNEEKIRERVNEMRDLADKMKDRMDALKEKAEKVDALKKQLEKLGLDKDNALKDGPGKDFEDALMKGDLDKAKAALEKIAKDFKNDKLNPMQQKELADQLKKLQDKLRKIADNDDFAKKLKQDFKDGKINKDDLERELERFRDLQELTDILGNAEEALGKGDGKKAGDELGKLSDRFAQGELTDKEIQELLRDQDEITDAMRLLLAGMQGGGDDDGLEGGGPPGTRRPIDPNDPNSKIRQERQAAKVDSRGQQRVTGYARGGNFNKVPSKEVGGAFRQAAQDGPEALERQRIPDDAADIARGYFNKLGNQK